MMPYHDSCYSGGEAFYALLVILVFLVCTSRERSTLALVKDLINSSFIYASKAVVLDDVVNDHL